jgi:hypothetical protein
VERLKHTGFTLFGPANEQLALSDQRVSSSEIAIQGQRPFIFSDAGRGAVGEAKDHPMHN